MLLSLYRSPWGYRGFILGSVKREFQARYCKSQGAKTTITRRAESIVSEGAP
jgi:lipopolysaccharide transport system permease protein